MGELRNIAGRIALGCESAYAGIGWSANDTDDLRDVIEAALKAERERCWMIAAECHRRAENDWRHYADNKNESAMKVFNGRALAANEIAAAIRPTANIEHRINARGAAREMYDDVTHLVKELSDGDTA